MAPFYLGFWRDGLPARLNQLHLLTPGCAPTTAPPGRPAAVASLLEVLCVTL
jgi:hypothetical protein